MPDILPADLRTPLLPQLWENRRMMNRPDGYWVLGMDPAAADHLDVATIQAAAGDRSALASDGFPRLAELFGVAAPDDLLGIETPTHFDIWLARLRVLESAADSYRRFPRVKESDDASFLQCVLG